MDCRLSPLAPRDLVSEYQYYDFRAIDRPLTKKEMAALRLHLDAGRNHHHELHEPLRMGRPESRSEQVAGEIFLRFCLRRELGGRMSPIFACRRNRSTRGCSRPWPRAIPSGCEKPRHS
jgi:hypothetical protein